MLVGISSASAAGELDLCTSERRPLACRSMPMAHQSRSSNSALLPLLALLLLLLSGTAEASVLGYSYSGAEDRVSSPEDVVRLLKDHAITKVRLYDSNHLILSALGNSSIDVIVGVLNDEVEDLAEDSRSAYVWVARNIVPYVGETNISIIAVGNEALTQDVPLSANLLQAMRNLHQALVEAHLNSRIKVSTPHSVSVLNYFPPSWGQFSHDLMSSILEFLSETQAPFMLNMYPYHEYQFVTRGLGLDYHLLNPTGGFLDPNSGLRYENAFHAIVDAVFTAMASLNYQDISIVVSETGWPSQNVSHEMGLSAAETFHGNLVRLVYKHRGTPMKPGSKLQVYTNHLSIANLQPCVVEKEQELPRSLDEPIAKHRRLSDGTGYVWCVVNTSANVYDVQAALNWTCARIDCSATNAGGSCFIPNTIWFHASWAYNSYYNSMNGAQNACNFSGTAYVTTNDPGTETCFYQGTSRSVAANNAILHGQTALISFTTSFITYFLVRLLL